MDSNLTEELYKRIFELESYFDVENIAQEPTHAELYNSVPKISAENLENCEKLKLKILNNKLKKYNKKLWKEFEESIRN